MSSRKQAVGVILMALAILVILSVTGCTKAPVGVSKLYPAKLNDQERWSMVDINGKVVVAKGFKDKPSMESEGMVYVTNDKGKYQYYTTDATPKKVGGEFWSASVFSEGLAVVVAGTEDNKYIAYIDKTGKPVITLKKLDGKQILRASRFNEGMAYVANEDNKFGYINKTGKLVIPCKYKGGDLFWEGLAKVSNSVSDTTEWKTGFINPAGKEVIPLKADRQYGRFSEGYCWFSMDGKKWGTIDKTGKEVIKPSDDYTDSSFFKNGLAVFSDGENKGLVDYKGNKVVRPKYTQIFQLPGGLLVGSEEGFGVINPKGKILLPLKNDYDFLAPLTKMTYLVKESKNWLIVDAKGKMVSKSEFEDFDPTGLLGFEYVEDSVRFSLTPEINLGDLGMEDYAAPEPAEI